jgi:hypothetical protein
MNWPGLPGAIVLTLFPGWLAGRALGKSHMPNRPLKKRRPPKKQRLLDDEKSSFDAVIVAVRDVIQDLGTCGGYWTEPQRDLLNWINESRDLRLDEQPKALRRLQSRLASVVNRRKPDLSKAQRMQLGASTKEAITACRRWSNALRDEIERDKRALQATTAALAKLCEENGTPPAGSLPALRQLAAKKLKGDERLIVERVCDGNGVCPLKELAMCIPWNSPYDGAFNSARQRINAKLKKDGWQIYRRDGAASSKYLERK